jgi:hypothetical protein
VHRLNKNARSLLDRAPSPDRGVRMTIEAPEEARAADTFRGPGLCHSGESTYTSSTPLPCSLPAIHTPREEHRWVS